VADAVEFLTSILEVPGSNLGQNKGIRTEIFFDFPQSLQESAGLVSEIGPRAVSSALGIFNLLFINHPVM
jgi:hypothetical protein